jgi:uncharacterized protein YdaU (DUF1376 family)
MGFMMHWYKHDPDAFLAGTAGLTLEETGAYIKIINLLYCRDGDLPDEVPLIRRTLGCHAHTWNGIKRRLISKGKIWISDGKIMAKRVEGCLNSARKARETNQKNAKRRLKSMTDPMPSKDLKSTDLKKLSNSNEEEDTARANGAHWVHVDSPQYRAWQKYREAQGKMSTPIDKQFGWNFPTEWPPT